MSRNPIATDPLDEFAPVRPAATAPPAASKPSTENRKSNTAKRKPRTVRDAPAPSLKASERRIKVTVYLEPEEFAALREIVRTREDEAIRSGKRGSKRGFADYTALIRDAVRQVYLRPQKG